MYHENYDISNNPLSFFKSFKVFTQNQYITNYFKNVQSIWIDTLHLHILIHTHIWITTENRIYLWIYDIIISFLTYHVLSHYADTMLIVNRDMSCFLVNITENCYHKPLKLMLEFLSFRFSLLYQNINKFVHAWPFFAF